MTTELNMERFRTQLQVEIGKLERSAKEHDQQAQDDRQRIADIQKLAEFIQMGGKAVDFVQSTDQARGAALKAKEQAESDAIVAKRSLSQVESQLSEAKDKLSLLNAERVQAQSVIEKAQKIVAVLESIRQGENVVKASKELEKLLAS
jgi:hypothetical protein